MSFNHSAKKWFLHTALSYLGTPYIYGGDDPHGFDCSGYVIECLKTIGFLDKKDDFTADGLLKHLLAISNNNKLRVNWNIEQVSTPETGALLFKLNQSGEAKHVVICLDEYFQIGASGGDSTTDNIKTAYQNNAFIKIRPIRYKE